MATIHPTHRLSDEARQTIRRYLEPGLGAAEVQRMIDEFEGSSGVGEASVAGAAGSPAPSQVPTRADLWAPSPARSLEEAKEKVRKLGGDRATLGYAAAGVGRLFTDHLPSDSLLERSYRNARPIDALVPALNVAIRAAEPQSPSERLELAREMFQALPMEPADPLQKGFAGLRMLMTVVERSGHVRVVGLDEMSTPLRNLRDDARSETLGRVVISQVEKSFDELRDLLARAPVSAPPQGIVQGVDTVTIGGVTLEVYNQG